MCVKTSFWRKVTFNERRIRKYEEGKFKKLNTNLSKNILNLPKFLIKNDKGTLYYGQATSTYKRDKNVVSRSFF